LQHGVRGLEISNLIADEAPAVAGVRIMRDHPGEINV
jgi:hypothetical protein